MDNFKNGRWIIQFQKFNRLRINSLYQNHMIKLHLSVKLSDCLRYEIYILEGYTGTCDVIESMMDSKPYVIDPEVCYERCLDTPGCRGVTFIQSQLTCIYHSCNCHEPNATVFGARFMWKYCLEGRHKKPTIFLSWLLLHTIQITKETKPHKHWYLKSHLGLNVLKQLHFFFFPLQKSFLLTWYLH